MKIGLSINSDEVKSQLKTLAGNLRPNAIKAASKGLGDQRMSVQKAVQEHVRGKLGGKGALAKSYRAKVYDKKENRFPQLHVYSKVPWAGTHERGATIHGKMLIPLNQQFGSKGIRGQDFEKIIQQLMRGGNAQFIRTKKGQVILMSENIAEYDAPLYRFKQNYRKKRGLKRLKRTNKKGITYNIPIAVLVNKVTIKKRTDVENVVKAQVPQIAESVESRLKNELLG
ncbi:MAG: DUF6441 family protein [Burkholderiales bacterium]|jgi:hypothetical protein|nr:DUF6441 family protein [Burkholderiales bacterium]